MLDKINKQIFLVLKFSKKCLKKCNYRIVNKENTINLNLK